MNDTFNVSGWVVDMSGTLGGSAFEGSQNASLYTTQDILALCGGFDGNALLAAVIGLFLTIAFLFYVRRGRAALNVNTRLFIDKAALTLIALLFAVVIMRLLRAG